MHTGMSGPSWTSVCMYRRYAQALDGEEEVKDSFCDGLQDAVDRVFTGDMQIVAGDWNARPNPVGMASLLLIRGVLTRPPGKLCIAQPPCGLQHWLLTSTAPPCDLATKTKLGQVGVTHCLLRLASAFD